MLDSFFQSYKLKNAYRVNSIIYSLKHIPLIKKLFSYSLYSSPKLKIFSNIISAIMEFISIFAGKFIYLFLFFSFTLLVYENTSLAFINIIFFLTIIGCLINTEMFSPSMDKYYAIMLLNFDAKKYVLVNYIYFLLKTVVGFIPFIIIYGLMYKVNIIVCLLVPLFIACMKNIFNYYSLCYFEKRNKAFNENKYSSHIIVAIILLLALAYLLPLINIGINETIFYFLFIGVFIVGVICLNKIIDFKDYNKVTKKLLKQDEIINFNAKDSEIVSYKNEITGEINITSNEKGYAYLNDLFVKRHRKLLTRSSMICSVIIFIIIIGLAILFLCTDKYNTEVNNILKNYLPYFMFIMYFINRGQKICQTMFMNCDHSMLTYRFYREPNAILSLFKERLKTLIKLNLVPGFIMSLGAVILLYVTGGATVTEYAISFFSIISMSIFFSIHYLVLYYLLQPYSINLEIKNPVFTAICGLTYFVCYMFSQVKIPTITFGICMCSFTIIYSFVSLFLAYKYAKKTFKLRI